MTAEYSEERLDEVGRPDAGANAEVTIQIEDRNGDQFIVIKEQRPTEPASMKEQTIEIPAALLPELKSVVSALEASSDDGGPAAKQPGGPCGPGFAHPSEEEFARILDFYHIAWQYEPRSFAIEWDGEGNPTSSFTPDFYLPEHDLYIELTTLKQPLVTKKNRKVRLLRELYPEVKIKVLYASDYRKLIEKFAASGTTGEQSPRQESDSHPVE